MKPNNPMPLWIAIALLCVLCGLLGYYIGTYVNCFIGCPDTAQVEVRFTVNKTELIEI